MACDTILQDLEDTAGVPTVAKCPECCSVGAGCLKRSHSRPSARIPTRSSQFGQSPDRRETAESMTCEEARDGWIHMSRTRLLSRRSRDWGRINDVAGDLGIFVAT